MPPKFLVVGKDEKQQTQTLFVDKYGRIRTGVVEYIKLIAQHNALDGVVVGVNTASPTTYNHILAYPLPLHSNTVGNDYTEATLSVTAAAGSIASSSSSLSVTFVSNLRNQIVKISGDVIVSVMVYYVTDGAEGTVNIDSVDVEIGAINTSDGTSRVIASKSVTVNRSTTNTAVTDAIFVILGNVDDKLDEGERLYLKVTINFTLTVDATGSTTDITRTATVRCDHYRATDDTYVMIPVVM